MYKVGLLLVIFLSFSSFLGENRPVNGIECSISNTSFQGTERLVFKAYYNWQFVWIPAGEAVFNIKETKTDYEVSVSAKTYDSYDAFFKVRDYFYSKIDKETLYPKNFVRIIEEGDYRKFDSIVFDQKNSKAYSINGKTRKLAKKKEFQYENCMHDLLSVFYFLRNINTNNFKKGNYIPTSVLLDSGIHPIKVRYDGKESKKQVKGLGSFNTVRVIPDLVVGEVFDEGNKMKVWVTDDANKMPIAIESPLKVGYAKVMLKSYSGLRNKMTAKVAK